MSSIDLLRHGDPTVRPQDDLFDHVNGRFMRTARIPDDRDGTGVWHEVHDRVRRDLEHIVATLGTGHPKGTPAQLVGDFHASFTDLPRLAAQGNDTLIELLTEAMRFDTPRQLSARFGLLMRHRLGSVLGVQIVIDRDNPSRYVPRFTQGGLGLPGADYYLSDAHAGLRNTYLELIERMFELVGLPDAAGMAFKVLIVESQLAALHADAITNRDVEASHNPIRFDKLQYLTRNLAWVPMLYEIDLRAEADPLLIIAQPDFVKGLDALLTADRMDDWRAWVAWRVVGGLADYATPMLASTYWHFLDVDLGGLAAVQPRNARVLAHVEHYLGDAMGQLYVERHFKAGARERISALIKAIIAEYRNTLESVHWLTTPTRAAALDKLDRLSFRVGYPRWWHDYSTLDIRPDDLLGNALRAAGHLTETDIDRLAGRESGEDWQVPPHVVNAYYDVSRNEIVFPAAFLQPPFFDPEAEDALNYGAIGSIIAHEISHAFDDRGSHFDAAGRFKEWWTPTDREAFQRVRAQFVQQLAATPSPDVPGVALNGELTVSEAMSDLGGLAVAYRAWRRTNPTEAVIDGTTAAQRFFLSHAGIWRQKEVIEETRFRLANDPHPPHKVRCNLTVRNFDPFHVAFDVRPGDGMWLRPGERLSLW